jgi:hypothetical protein
VTARYLPEANYNALVATLATVPALLNINVNASDGVENQIKLALGKLCDVWPESIRGIATT